jgi:palmitoyltransferase ZDHHC3/7/25
MTHISFHLLYAGPWVNNCVGIGNQKLFLLFVGWTGVVCTYALVLVVMMFIFCTLSE